MRLTARRAAVEAAGDAQRQLHAMIITAPEVVRAKFRGQSTRAMLATAARLRPTASNADVARGTDDLLYVALTGELPCKRVLAGAAANNEDSHGCIG